MSEKTHEDTLKRLEQLLDEARLRRDNALFQTDVGQAIDDVATVQLQVEAIQRAIEDEKARRPRTYDMKFV